MTDVEPFAVAAVLGPDLVTYPNGDRTAYVTTAFACRADEQPSYDGDELDALRWVNPTEAQALPLASWLRPWISQLVRWQPGDPTIFS